MLRKYRLIHIIRKTGIIVIRWIIIVIIIIMIDCWIIIKILFFLYKMLEIVVPIVATMINACVMYFQRKH